MTSESDAAAQMLRDRGTIEPVSVGIILGSGLGSIADNLDEPAIIPYASLPGFPKISVSGHDGQLAIGGLEGQTVAILRGRTHYYESGDMGGMATPLESLAKLGCHTLIVTNAAGSLHPDWYPGSLCLISDHINFTGSNPLFGMTGDDRFVPMLDAYDKRLRARMRRAASAATIANLREGVYMCFPGPSFETVAEVKMAKVLGADLVGMSTVPEVILARRLGLKVAGISVITNLATGISGANPSHDETKQSALSGSVALRRLLRAFMRSTDLVTA